MAVVGAQWGDEGKGKIVDALAADADIIARYGGGANAGHTIWVDGKKTVLHLLPSSILRPGKTNVVGPYVVVDPEVLVAELAIARKIGATVILDPRCQVVTPLHRQIDVLRELTNGTGVIGTTGKGIGPAYEDLAARRGPKLRDLLSTRRMFRALRDRHFLEERMLLIRTYAAQGKDETDPIRWRLFAENGRDWPELELSGWGVQHAETIAPHLKDAAGLIDAADGKTLLFEGAQGIMLGMVAGTQPYVTASLTGPGAIGETLGVHRLDRVIGVAKAYVTRVGGGPFPTETPEKGDWLRERGAEYGATTGRPRRCGWLDLVALRYACRMGGITELVITKLDVLRGLAEIPLCRAYHRGDGAPCVPEGFDAEGLDGFQPIYETLPGWSEDISGCRSWDDLPENVRTFLNLVSLQLGVPVTGASVGPEREQIAWR
ncbi:adenylosuccinate synthase [Patescibacteria group bacterium]|nr:MAG: adenylosuccinate synthase [Patescibacteria group bacterium]